MDLTRRGFIGAIGAGLAATKLKAKPRVLTVLESKPEPVRVHGAFDELLHRELKPPAIWLDDYGFQLEAVHLYSEPPGMLIEEVNGKGDRDLRWRETIPDNRIGMDLTFDPLAAECIKALMQRDLEIWIWKDSRHGVGSANSETRDQARRILGGEWYKTEGYLREHCFDAERPHQNAFLTAVIQCTGPFICQ